MLLMLFCASPTEKCIQLGRSHYSTSMGGSKVIGGGALGLRGFFQSLRPTQQGLALNMTRSLASEERKEVEKALKNIRVFVCHRDTVQKYRVQCLTEETTEDLWFTDRDGRRLKLTNYFEGSL
ncbi:hypothetical protein Nepgr_003597 [Nepenthes gracilis]|uniref:PAZ domain-containing protein n=1 Tax=Nepenthes gracilis TaxID=150966 RepID=A0AAD3RZX1_NEPGR|nr:hypothetical protein Nepgr_003597 [Nepenthes gracilis]